MKEEMPDFESNRQAKNWEKLNLEMLANLEKWKPTGMLTGVEDHPALVTAYLMENQRLFNENADMDEGFRRATIPLVRRMFDPKKFIGWQLVSIQAMRSPNSQIKSTWNSEPYYESCQALTRRLKTRVDPLLWQRPDAEQSQEDRLAKEAEVVAKMAAALTAEFNDEILSDLRNNAANRGKLSWRDGAAQLWRALSQFRQSILERRGFLPNWVVTGPEAATLLKEVTEVQLLDHDPEWQIGPTAKLNDELLLIEDSNQKDISFLVGYKGSPYSSQYIFAPYIPLSSVPIQLDKDDWNKAIKGMLHRYAKRLLSQTDNYYGVLRNEASVK